MGPRPSHWQNIEQPFGQPVINVPTPLSIPHTPAGTSGGGFFRNARDFEITQSQFYDFSVNGVSGLDILRLYVIPDTLHDAGARFPPPKCHPETREKLLLLVSDWMNKSTNKPIMWLNGPAGCGKTTIAQTIAERYSETGQLAASFFFSRHRVGCGTVHGLFPTLAWQLAKTFPEIAELIGSAVTKDPLIATKTLDIQFTSLIEEPLKELYRTSFSPSRNFVVIVDAVDECNDEQMQEHFLTHIRKALPDVSEGTVANVPVRFLICSRRETHIEKAFAADGLLGLTNDLSLINDPNVLEDIRKFLTHEFSRIRREHAIAVETPWPSHEVIDLLVQKSSGQFIYASTVVKFIDARHYNPVQQLQVVLGLRRVASRQPFAELDALYLEILDRQTDYKLLMKVLVYMAALGQAEVHYVSQQLSLSEEELRIRLGGMVSLLHISFFIESYHICFLDFIMDATRAQKYHVNPLGFKVLRVKFPLLVKIHIKFAYFAFARRSYIFVFLMAPVLVVFLPGLIYRALMEGPISMIALSGLSILEEFVPSECVHTSVAQLPLSCHPGTQKFQIKFINDWINDPSSQNSFMVLRGAAGTGKSTIACTVARLSNASGKLAAIFFYRSGIYWNASVSLIPSLALSLAKSIPKADAYIISTLKTDPFLLMKSIEIQIDRLIVKLFEQQPQTLEQIAVIIDGVDLFPEGSKMDKSLRLFAKAVIEHQLPLRVLVCGRVQTPIIRMFETEIFSACTSTLTLDGDHAPANEIRIFLQKRVRGIFRRLQIPTPPSYHHDVDRLVSISADSFVYATTAVRFLESSSLRVPPHETLHSLVNGDFTELASSRSELDQLYITILSGLRNKRMGMSILASVVAVRRPLRWTLIREWLVVVSKLQAPNQSSFDVMKDSLQDLQSLLYISDFFAEVHHPSLREFLQDPNRARDFYVSPLKLLGIRWFYNLPRASPFHCLRFLMLLCIWPFFILIVLLLAGKIPRTRGGLNSLSSEPNFFGTK